MAKDVIARLKVEHSQWDSGFSKAGKTLKDFEAKNLSMAGAMDQGVKALASSAAKYVGWGAAVAGAMKVAKDAFMANEQQLDEWGRIQQSAEGAYKGFLNALNNGDISGYLSNINQIINTAREAYNALDELGTFKAFNQVNQARNKAGYSEALEAYKLNPTAENKKALSEANDKVVKDLKDEAKKQKDAYTAALEELFSQRGLKGEALKEAKKLFQGGSYADLKSAQKGYEKSGLLERSSAKWNGKEVTNVNGMGYYMDKYGGIGKDMTKEDQARYQVAKALSQVNDTEIETVQKLGAQAFALEQSVAEQNRSFNRLAGNNGSGSSKGSNTNTEKTRLQEINAEIQKLEQQWFKAGDAEKAVIAANIKKLDEEKKGIEENIKALHEVENVPVAGSIEEAEAAVKKLEEAFKKAGDQGLRDSINAQLEEAKAYLAQINGEADKLEKKRQEADAKKVQADLEKSQQLTSGFNDKTSSILNPTASIGDQFTKGPETNEEAFQRLVSQYDQLSAAIEAAKAQNADSDGAIIDPTAIEEASLQLEGLKSQIEELGPIIQEQLNFDHMIESVNNVSSAFSQIDGMVSGVESLANSWAEADSALDYFHATMQTVTTALGIFNTVMTTVNTLQKLFGGTTTSTAGSEMSQAAATSTNIGLKTAENAANIPLIATNKALTASYLEAAAAAYYAAHAAIPFVGFAIASGFVSASVASIKAIGAMAFAEGGMITDGAFTGDAVPIMANAGEVVLNQSQQENLAGQLESNAGGSAGARTTISGEQLVTVINNYGKRTGRGEILR